MAHVERQMVFLAFSLLLFSSSPSRLLAGPVAGLTVSDRCEMVRQINDMLHGFVADEILRLGRENDHRYAHLWTDDIDRLLAELMQSQGPPPAPLPRD